MFSGQDTVFFSSVTSSSHDTAAEMESIVFPVPPVRTSFFTTHLLKAGEIDPSSFKKFQPDWIFLLFLIAFGLLAWIQASYSKRLRQILLAPYSKRFLNQLVRDGNIIKERISVALLIVYVIGISLLLYEMNILLLHHTGVPVSGLPLFLWIVVGLLAYWFVKLLMVFSLGIIFRTYQATREYILNIFILIFVSGIILLPLLVLTVYLESTFLLYICLFFFVLLFIFRFIRGFFIGISVSRFSYMLLFVYLCSLEILPVILVAKLILSY
jgi:hypothetical protein